MSFNMQKYTHSESLFNTLYIEIKHKCSKNFPQTKCYKICTFFFHTLQFITGLLLICNFIWAVAQGECRILHFGFCLVFIKVYFCLTKSVDPLALKCHDFQNKNNRKARHSFGPRHMIFNVQQGVWKFNICMSWGSPKTDLVTSLLNLGNWSFE